MPPFARTTRKNFLEGFPRVRRGTCLAGCKPVREWPPILRQQQRSYSFIWALIMDDRVIQDVFPEDLKDFSSRKDKYRFKPSILSTDPVESYRDVSLILPTFFNTALKQRSLVHLLNHVDRSRCGREIILSISDSEPQ